MNGSRALFSSCSTAVVFAIWNSEADAFLHARAAGRGDAHERHPVLVGDAHAAHEALADHRAHRAAHELELERREHQRHALDAALHHDQRVGLAGFLERRGEALRIFLLVLELEAVDRHDFRADLEAAFGIEQLLEALARGDALVMRRTSGKRRGCSRDRCDRAPLRTTGT